MFDIVVLTDSRYVAPKNPDQYVQNVLTEDGLVEKALTKLGLKVTKRDWADSSFDWSTTKFALFRTTWDYFDKFDAFKAWLSATSNVTTFINSIDIIRWNMDKSYLQDLMNNGIRIAPTQFIAKGETSNLASIYTACGWNEAVLKPAIAGGARHTYRINETNIHDVAPIFDSLVANEDFLLQEFQNNIVSQGEISLMIMGGKYTHAVLKIAKPGDFRVQDDFGGAVHSYTPSPEEIAFAEQAVQACHTAPIYARVDVFRDNNNNLALGELELIEPELWFREKPEAAIILAKTIVAIYFPKLIIP